MKKFLMTAVAAGVVALSSLSASAQVLPVSLYKPGGATSIVQNITDIDYNSNGAAVVIGAGPFGGAVSVGQVFTNLFQTNVTGFNRGPDAVGASEIAVGLNDAFASGGYEITAVARLTEIVVAASPNTATFVVLGGTVALYYDDASSGGTKSNLAAGTGFDDGKLIYSGNIVSGSSGFNVIGNIGLGSTNVITSTTSVDATAIQNLPANLLAFFLNAEGQNAYPAGNAATNNYHIGGSAAFPDYTTDNTCAALPGPVGSCDLQLRFDGSSRFVPEPGGLALLGVAAIALGAGARRSRKQA